ncbi:DUF2795 domain-containing protein [Proteobacteria bacterium 005FR1]|nr:DUF2795 domain-containing protein [Proteobacteria bacterium 005FR1]
MANSKSVSPVEVEKYVAGINFPVNKNQLVDHAREKGAPKEVLDFMSDFPERDYVSAADVAKGVGQVRH